MESQTPSAQVFLKAKDIAKFMFVAPVKYPPNVSILTKLEDSLSIIALSLTIKFG